VSARSAWRLLTGGFIAAMIGLAAGAVWMVLTLYLGHAVPWLALPVGALLGRAIRGLVAPAGWPAGVLAALATLLATIYVNLLIAGVVIAGNMGLGLIDTLSTAGPGMLWQLARLGLTRADVAWTVLAMLLAAWLGWRAPRKS
jgi:hypothetical protein